MKHTKEQIGEIRNLLLERELADRVLRSTKTKGKYYLVLNVARDTLNPKGERSIIYIALFGNYDIWVMPEDVFYGSRRVDGINYPMFDYAIEDDEAMDAILSWYDYNKERNNLGDNDDNLKRSW